MAAPPPPPRGLSLYENLHDPNDPSPSATISSAPVLYNQDTAAAVKKPIDPALRFQPTRRLPPAKPSNKPPKSLAKPAAAAPTQAAPSETAAAAKSSLADWAAAPADDEEWLYGGAGEKRQRGGRKARKKREREQHRPMETDWDDVYDPARPTNVDEYLRSDEKVDEVREWKALLYRHRKGKASESGVSSEDEDERTTIRPHNQFAPPPSYGAVPPPPASPPTTTAAAPTPPDNASGDDAYARRLAISSSQAPPPRATSSTTISAAPILYTTTEPQQDPPPSSSSPRSALPGQAGFAHRLMAKYGWASGTGLGADSSGIVNPLRVQVEKRRRKADADGGGWAEPANKAKIVGGGGKRAGAAQELSDVVVLLHMVDNMPDLAAEVENGLGQEIGEECGEKYGRVERVYIDTATQRVFIKFTDQISALKAVSELQGRVFNGNTITPKYYNSDAFDRGVYTK